MTTQTKPIVTFVSCGLIAAMGVFAVLIGLHVVPDGPRPGVQSWLVIVTGATFTLGGLAAALAQVNGRLARIIANLASLGVALGLTATSGWVALGPGHHAIASPFMIFGPAVGEATGRAAFGLGALLGALIVAMMLRSFLRGGLAVAQTPAPTSRA